MQNSLPDVALGVSPHCCNRAGRGREPETAVLRQVTLDV